MRYIFLLFNYARHYPCLFLIGVGCAFVFLAFDSESSRIYDSITSITAIMGLFLSVCGFICLSCTIICKIIRRSIIKWQIDRKKVTLIEIWGLQDIDSESLVNSIPSIYGKRRKRLSIDIRKWIKNNKVVSPEKALEQLNSLPAKLSKINARYSSLLYGSLAPVPFTFLAGNLIDDNRSIIIFDRDRDKDKWRELDGNDDGKRFNTPDLNKVIEKNISEIALAVSVSYHVSPDDVQKKVDNMPFVELELDGISQNCHWSEKKQVELVNQFIEIVNELNYHKIKRIHLFLASPSSIAFRFGKRYDKRNLPEIIVYQYQRDEPIPYPWGVLMPVGGVENAEIIYS